MRSDWQRDDLGERLLWLTLFRVVANTLSLAAVAVRVVLALPKEPAASEMWGFGIIAGIYGATLAYALRLRRGKVTRVDAWVQVSGDVLFASAIVFLTGFGESPFIFAYSLAIISAALLLQTRGALVVASVSAVAFAAVVLWAQTAAWGGGAKLPPSRLAFILLSNVLAFVLIAVLAGYLSRQLTTTGGRLVAREQDLRSLADLHRQILTAMPSGLMTADAEGRVTFANPAAEAILGRTDLLGREIHEPLPGFSSLGRSAQRRELRIPAPQGSRILGLSLTPLRGEEASSLIVFQDLTELRRLEMDLRKADQLAALGRMAAQLAHEIRNPLAAMRGSAQLLGQESAASPTAERLTRILTREADRLSRLVEDVLRFSRPNVPNRRSVDLGELARETVEMLREDPLALAVRLEVAVETMVLEVDPDQLRQVLLNLVRNALQAAGPEGTVRVTVSRGTTEAMLRVWDSGEGIDESVRARLFEPFFTTRQGGTGLGLATAHALIHAHGGSLRVRSSAGQGTQFEATLPLRAANPGTPPPLAA